MDIILFYNYLNYQKEVQNNFKKKILKIPKIAILLLIILVASSVLIVVFYFIPPLRFMSNICLLIEFISVIILYFYSEYYQIKMSYKKLEVYKAYCLELREWLKGLSVLNSTDIQKIKDRIVLRIDKRKKEYDRICDRRDKWMQIFFIPIILSVLSVLIKDQNDIYVVISYVVLTVLFYISVYSIICAIIFICNIIEKKELGQLQSFADDLQGILDIQCFDNTANKRSK